MGSTIDSNLEKYPRLQGCKNSGVCGSRLQAYRLQTASKSCSLENVCDCGILARMNFQFKVENCTGIAALDWHNDNHQLAMALRIAARHIRLRGVGSRRKRPFFGRVRGE